MNADLSFILHPFEERLVKIPKMPPSMRFNHNNGSIYTFNVIHRIKIQPPYRWELCEVGLCSDLRRISGEFEKYNYLFGDLSLNSSENKKKFIIENLISCLLKKYFNLGRRK